MRQLSILIFLLIALSAHSQQNAKFEIYKTIGHVLNASTQKDAKRGEAVEAKDKLIIGKDSKAGILDRQQHRIYYTQNPGTHSVASIIQKAKRMADNAVAVVNSEALNQLKNDGRQPKVRGVSYRGSDAENAYLQSVCNAIYDIPKATPNQLLRLDAVNNDDAFHFSMTNGADSLIYVNVIAIRPDGSHQLCLNVGMTDNQPYISIAPHSELTLPEFEFFDREPAEYYMVATFNPVDTQALSLLLNVGKRFDGVENASIIVSPKITAQSHE